MSNRSSRRQETNNQPRIGLADPVVAELADATQVRKSAMAELPRNVRRRIDRMEFRKSQQLEQRPLTMADVPAGSVLSARTIAAIKAGEYTAVQPLPSTAPPMHSRAPLRRARARMEKQSRKRNRKKKD